MREYSIQFVGLKVGSHKFEYEIDNSFFDLFEFDEFNDTDVKVTLKLEKKSTLMELTFDLEGQVNLNCDLTNEPFNQAIDNTMELVVKFGEEFNDEHLDILILPHGAYEFNVAQYIYEMIVLAVPTKRIHPGVKDGSLKSEILDRLNELSLNEQTKNDKDIDPRWQKLKNIITDK